jgi:hypothetical protein
MIMQALREIHNVTSDTLTIKIPPNISHTKAEVIILFLEDKVDELPQKDPWEATRQFRKKLEQKGRVFNDSVELIREDRER